MNNDFDLSSVDAADEAVMEVTISGKPVGWKWTFAGPGHPQTVEQGNRVAKERLRREADQEQARVNGRKWKAPDEAVDEVRERNVEIVLGRLLGWSPVKLNGQDYPFTPDNARSILMDHRKGHLLIQALEFLGEDQSFMTGSVNG